MPSDFITVAALDLLLEDHINQFAAWLNGDTNYYKVATPKANDASNYLMTIQNVGSGGLGLLVKNSSGTNIFSVGNAGVGMLNNTGLFPGVLSGTPVSGGLYRDNLVSAWATGTMSGTVWTQTDGFNLTMVRASQGVFTGTFATALGASTYAMLAMAGTNNLTPVESAGVPRSTTQCQMAFYNSSDTLTDPTVGISFLVVGPG